MKMSLPGVGVFGTDTSTHIIVPFLRKVVSIFYFNSNLGFVGGSSLKFNQLMALKFKSFHNFQFETKSDFLS